MSVLAWVGAGIAAWFALAAAIAVPVGRLLARRQPPDDEGEVHR